MTEAEWLASDDPQAMLFSLEREWDKGGTYYVASDRKLRLFACAAIRSLESQRKSTPVSPDWLDHCLWALDLVLGRD